MRCPELFNPPVLHDHDGVSQVLVIGMCVGVSNRDDSTIGDAVLGIETLLLDDCGEIGKVEIVFHLGHVLDSLSLELEYGLLDAAGAGERGRAADVIGDDLTRRQSGLVHPGEDLSGNWAEQSR